MGIKYSATMNVMMKAVRKAERRLVRDFGEVEQLQVSRKGPSDFVSAADIQAEETIIEELQHARPNYGLLVEEAGEIEGSDPDHRWIVDPIDGTTNFLHGIPHWCSVIALEKKIGDKKEIIAAVVHAPILGETFWAEKGQGAFCQSRDGHGHGTRLRVSVRKRIEDVLLGTGTVIGGIQPHRERIRSLVKETVGVRSMAAAALDLAYTAAGRYDAFIHEGLRPWDVAAGILLVREAGGVVTDLKRQQTMLESGNIIAGNEVIHAKLQAML